MRHQKKRYRIGTTPAHRRSLLRNLSISVIAQGNIVSTLAKTKALRPFFEKIITLAKNDTVANRRLAFKKLGNRNAVNRLFGEIAPKFKNRPGGYTRIVRVADGRVGDNAEMAYFGLVE